MSVILNDGNNNNNNVCLFSKHENIFELELNYNKNGFFNVKITRFIN